ncbi:MAG: DUF721 domain-containing protein [Leptospira sp.]|nr:DUF721 domain-containing protein [Leptospira sp.]
MKKLEIQDLFQSLEKLGINKEEIFNDQTIKILKRDWKEIVGDVLADGSQPNSLLDGKLFVLCKHAIVTQELDFAKAEILKKISLKKLPLPIIKIIFKTGNSPNLKR